MGLSEGIRPTFRLLANAADITDAARERLISLRMTDAAGFDSDTLEIVLDDGRPDEPIAMPPTGAELELFLGYDGNAKRMGLFVVDEIELSGWPSLLTIRARAAPFDLSKGGKETLQSQKTRSWPAGTTLGAMVRKMAGEHGMQAAVSASLDKVALPHTDQPDESDLHLLVRLARKYDAIVKPAGGKLVLAKRGEAQSMGGQDLPPVTITPDAVTSYAMRTAKRDDSGSVVAAWHETRKSKRHTITVGEGEPVTRIRRQFTDAAQARAAAQAEMDRRTRASVSLSVTMPGNPDAAAEGRLNASGFRDGINGEWIILRVEHSLGGGAGYTCSVECETANAGAGYSLTSEAE